MEEGEEGEEEGGLLRDDGEWWGCGYGFSWGMCVVECEDVNWWWWECECVSVWSMGCGWIGRRDVWRECVRKEWENR